MRVVWGCKNAVSNFVADKISLTAEWKSNCQTAAVFDDQNELAAGVVFHQWAPDAGVIEITCAAKDPRWCQREVMKAIFGYVFGFCQMCVFRVHEDNKRTRRLIRAFGATEHRIPRLRGREAAEILMTLTDDDWSASKFAR